MDKQKKILTSGSIAYDRIVDFSGVFGDHIMPDKISDLNVCFVVDRMNESFGGTAGNIAYSLSLLDENPILLGVVGSDFDKYEKYLSTKNVDISYVKKYDDEFTAAASIITDKDDNQITSYYQGPLHDEHCDVVRDFTDVDLAIISPEVKERMLKYAALYKELNVPYIFDPGQQITALSGDELREAIDGAYILIGNEYEFGLIQEKMKISLEDLGEMVEILIITKGDKGSEIYQNGEKQEIKPVQVDIAKDPTGAGDAFRSGLIKGIVSGLSLVESAQLAAVVAAYNVEQNGTQVHEFSLDDVRGRYEENYKTTINI